MKRNYLIGLALLLILLVVGIGFLFISDEYGFLNNSQSEAVNTLDPEKDVDIENKYNQSRTVGIEITRDSTGEIAHSEEYMLEAESSMEPAHTITVPEDSDIETFTLNATVDGQTEQVGVTMNECYGNAHIEVKENGELNLLYSTC